MRSTVFVFALLGCVMLARPAVAKPKVAVVAIDGDQKEKARQMVKEALEDDVTVVPAKQVNRTIKELGYDATALTEKNLRKLGKELEADAIIQAKLSTKGKDKLLRFRLFVHGKKAKGFKVEFGSLTSARLKQQLHDKLLERLALDDDTSAVASTTTSPGTGDDDAKLLKSTTNAKPGGGDDGATPSANSSAPSPRVAQSGDDATSVGAHVDVTPASDRSPSAHSANRDAVRFDVGPSASTRSLSFNSRSFMQAPKTYSNSLVPGARIDGEIYPFAFGNPDRIAAGIGLGGLYDQTLALSVTTTTQAGTKFPVTQRRYSIGPRFRIMFGHTETSPSLVIGVGYGQREFTVDRAKLMAPAVIDLPDVDYTGYDPSLVFRLPLTPRLALSIGGGALLLTGSGPITTAPQYGQATVTGAEGELAFDMLFTPRIGARLSFDFAQIGFKFENTGAMANDRDNNPSTEDVYGATDRYLGGAATLVVSY